MNLYSMLHTIINYFETIQKGENNFSKNELLKCVG